MTTSSTPLDAADEAAIHSIVADIEQGFNDNDPELLVRHIAPDALIVNPLGVVMRRTRGSRNIDPPTARGPAPGHYRPLSSQ